MGANFCTWQMARRRSRSTSVASLHTRILQQRVLADAPLFDDQLDHALTAWVVIEQALTPGQQSSAIRGS